MALAHITDLTKQLAARVLSQYQGLPKVMGVIAGITDAGQEIENALWDIVLQFQVSTAHGVWLELLGKIVNQARGGLNDAGYRFTIAARIIANGSNGEIDKIIKAVCLAVGGFAPGSGEALVEWNYAAFSISIPHAMADLGGQTGDVLLRNVLGILRGVKSGGVKAMLMYQDDVDAEIFVCGDATGAVTPTGKGFDNAAAPNDPTAGRLSGADVA